MRHLVQGSLSMENVDYLKLHEISLQMQMSRYSSQEIGKAPGYRGKGKRKDRPLIDNEVTLRIPQSKPNIPPTKWVYWPCR